MTDLKPLFDQCVQIVQSEGNNDSNRSSEPMNKIDAERKISYIISDTFNKECKEFYNAVVHLNKFLKSIKTAYLGLDGSFSGNSKVIYSSEQKSQVDTEVSLKIQQMYEKLKYLQNYESKRQAIHVGETENKGWFGNVFRYGEISDEQIFYISIGIYRTNILKFLTTVVKTANKEFESTQRKRLQRERQMNLINFQNIDDDDVVNDFHDLENIEHSLHNTQREEESQESGYSQSQLQELESENKEFLMMKTDQLKQVESLHTSMLDIIKLQSELTFQLESQGNQISNLLDNQSRIEIDVYEGNKTLTKATKRNKKGANIFVAITFLLSILILIVDYITW